MNNVMYFEIQATDLPATMDFYRAVFDWRFVEVPGPAVTYWRIETEGIDGGLLQRPAPAPAEQSGTNAYVCSMQVADFDTTAAAILGNGGRVALDKFAVPGKCWQGYFIDPEGNTFGLFQIDPGAA